MENNIRMLIESITDSYVFNNQLEETLFQGLNFSHDDLGLMKKIILANYGFMYILVSRGMGILTTNIIDIKKNIPLLDNKFDLFDGLDRDYLLINQIINIKFDITEEDKQWSNGVLYHIHKHRNNDEISHGAPEEIYAFLMSNLIKVLIEENKGTPLSVSEKKLLFTTYEMMFNQYIEYAKSLK